MKIFLALALACTLSACVSVSPNVIDEEQPYATVTIYRSDQVQGSAVDVYVGWADNYHVVLSPEDKLDVQVPAGLQTFQIRAHADLSNDLTIKVMPNEHLCLLAEVNPQNFVGLNWFVSGYQLRQIECVSQN